MSNATAEQGAKVAGLNRATVAACVAVVGLAAWMFWPRSEIRLVSPDGKHTVLIEATNAGAKISVSSSDTGEVLIRAIPESGPTVAIEGKQEGYFGAPAISLRQPGARDKVVSP